MKRKCCPFSRGSEWKKRRDAYRDTVIDRFRNPFLDHRLAEIFINHEAKKQRRFGGLIELAEASDCHVEPAAPQSRARFE